MISFQPVRVGSAAELKATSVGRERSASARRVQVSRATETPRPRSRTSAWSARVSRRGVAVHRNAGAVGRVGAHRSAARSAASSGESAPVAVGVRRFFVLCGGDLRGVDDGGVLDPVVRQAQSVVVVDAEVAQRVGLSRRCGGSGRAARAGAPRRRPRGMEDFIDYSSRSGRIRKHGVGSGRRPRSDDGIPRACQCLLDSAPVVAEQGVLPSRCGSPGVRR